MKKLEQAIAYFEDAIRESDEIIAECSEALQKELTKQKGHFEVALEALKKQIPQKVVETPDKHKYGYCPVCGRIYWDKCHVGNYCDSCGQRLEVEQDA
jgi:uncharacterized protein with PIN domain